MGNTYKYIGILLDANTELDQRARDYIRKVFAEAAEQMRAEGRHVGRTSLADELGIHYNRMTRLVKALELGGLFD